MHMQNCVVGALIVIKIQIIIITKKGCDPGEMAQQAKDLPSKHET